MIILEENFKWHLEAFASELFNMFNESRNCLVTDIVLNIRKSAECIQKR